MHSYADDTQIYLVFTDLTDNDAVYWGCTKIENCLSDIHAWKTHIIWIILFGTKASWLELNIPSIDAASSRTETSTSSVWNLGVDLDSSLSMKSQVNKIIQTTAFHLWNIGRVRKNLNVNATKSLIQSPISWVDYGNSLLCGLSQDWLCKPQSVQNKAACMVMLTKMYKHITPVLRALHWLPVDVRIDF